MKKAGTYFLFFIFVLISGCGRVERTPALTEADLAYATAVKVAERMPFFNPDENNTLVKSKAFVLSTGDICRGVHNTMAEDIDRLTELSTREINEFLQQVTRSLTERKLLDLESSHLGIDIAETELDSVLNLYYASAGSKERYGEQLQAQGKTLKDFEDDIRGLQIRQKYLSRLTSDIPASTEAEIETAYQQLKKQEKATVQHILLMTQGKTAAQKRKVLNKMRGLLRRAKRGEDFSALATKYTEDPGSKDNGGLYEDFGRGVMVKAFEDAAFSVPVGEISEVVETQHGYHILKVLKRSAALQALSEIKARVAQQVRMAKQNEAYQKAIMDLKLKYEVTTVTF